MGADGGHRGDSVDNGDDLVSLLLLKASSTRQIRSSDVPNASLFYGFRFPDYLEAVDASDPDFIELARSAEKYALKPPGQGGILDFMIVRTKWSVPMNRLYG